MATYKVLKPFQDKYTLEIYSPGCIVEMLVKRAKEAEQNLKEYDGPFLERLKEVEE